MSDWRGPLADGYWAAVALVLCALTRFLVLTSATFPLSEAIAKGVGLGEAGMEMTTAMANAAWAPSAGAFVVGHVLQGWRPA